MARGSICEPVEVNPATAIRAERVAITRADPAPERFPHFHDAAELIWFSAVDGSLDCEDGAFLLESGTAVFVPPMHRHDFAIPPGDHRWVLVHLDPFLTASLLERTPAPSAAACRVVRCAGALRQRMELLFDWLAEASADGSPREILVGLAGLILKAMILADAAADPEPGATSGAIDRLRPALDRIARNPGQPITLGEAASVCHLSEAYFSRRFKQVFGSTFSDYLRAYRLRLAAQRLLSGGERVSEIARATGFASPAHMTEQFRRRFGVTPRAYRAGAR
ncbi:MAG: AraC family transcriptional regulator [Novosphingobium sp.]|uniref:helix-turn-helix transcriptional regulator n=1 Tax=Novosphingobium sp. TaxID=1874826 RepID=UPI0030169A57